MTDELPDLQLERYELVRKLGEGGMAEVFEVRHRQLGSRHALKLFRRGSRKLAERLEQEGQVQARLSHPNVVAVTDVVAVKRRSALVLEYVDGLPLDAWLVEHPGASDAVRRRVMCQILAGVRHAHERGTIHRDLKPGNVLVTGADDDPHVKVADFGLAKWLEAPSHTRSGIPMGTPRYMAPEQLKDAKNVDERADVFSLGCVIAELWSGAPIFEEGGLLTVYDRAASAAYTLPDDLPEDIEEVVRACLQPDPEERPPSVEALQQRLGCTGAPAVVVGSQAGAVSSRLPWLAAGLGGGMALTGAVVAVGVVVLSVLLAAAVALWPVAPEGPAEPRPAPVEPRPEPRPAPTRPEPRPDPVDRSPPARDDDDDDEREREKERERREDEREKEREKEERKREKEREKENRGKGKGKSW